MYSNRHHFQDKLDAVLNQIYDLLQQVHTLAKCRKTGTPFCHNIDLLYYNFRQELLHLRHTAERLIISIPDDPNDSDDYVV